MSKPGKLLKISSIVISFISIGMIGLAAVMNYLSNQVYAPLGAISQEKALSMQFLGMMVFIPAAFFLLAMIILTPIALVFSVIFWKRRELRLSLLIFVAISVLTSFLMVFQVRVSNSKVFHRAFEGVTQRSELLISALESYKAKHGEYPDRLDQLVPEFIKEIPHTGLAGYPDYKYSKEASDAPFKKYELLIETS